MEIWKAIEGYEGRYEVSNEGRVRTLSYKGGPRVVVMNATLDSWGYPTVTLASPRATFNVHRLVALAFLGPRPERLEINHIDSDKMNAAVTNLEYVTGTQNQRHAFAAGTKSHYGEKNPFAKLTGAEVQQIRDLYAAGFGTVELAQMYSIHRTTVRRIVRRFAWPQLGEKS